MTKIVGLTGGIATGKTTVSTILRQAGIPVIDADQVARQVQTPDSVGLTRIVKVIWSESTFANWGAQSANLSKNCL